MSQTSYNFIINIAVFISKYFFLNTLNKYNLNTNITPKKINSLMEDVDNRGGYACLGAGDIWAIFVPSTQFCCEPRTAVKN